MQQYPKQIKRALREIMAQAYERELERELRKLDQSFAEWRAGSIGSGELSYRVHQYETGPSRELFKQYNMNQPDLCVAYAIVVGILEREEVAPEVLAAIGAPLAFYQGLQDRNELKLPEES